MAFLFAIGKNFYYNELFHMHIHKYIQDEYGTINLSYRLEDSKTSLSHPLTMLTKQESIGFIVYDQDAYLPLQHSCDELFPTIKINPHDYYSYQNDAITLHFYPEAFFHTHHTPTDFSSTLWIYPLHFDISTSLLFLEPWCQTYNVKLIPIAITQTQHAFVAQSPDSFKLAEFVQHVITHFKNNFFITYNLIQSLHELLMDSHQTLSTAESFTGGKIAHLITSYPESSNIFQGGVIAYNNTLKKKWLEIPSTFLKSNAVSEVTTRSMAYHIMKSAESDYGIATTGIMTSDDNTSFPIGTAFIAVVHQSGKEDIQMIHFTGSKSYMQEQASHYSLFLLLKMLLGA